MGNGIVPRNSTVVDRTWQYVNKSEGLYERFANNRQLPILLYPEVLFASSSGLNEPIQFQNRLQVLN